MWRSSGIWGPSTLGYKNFETGPIGNFANNREICRLCENCWVYLRRCWKTDRPWEMVGQVFCNYCFYHFHFENRWIHLVSTVFFFRYIHLYRCVCEGIEKAASNPNSKSPTAVVRFENYHHLYCKLNISCCFGSLMARFCLVTLSELKIPFLDAQRKDAKREKEENIDLYVREYMGRPLEKIHVGSHLLVLTFLSHIF